MIRPWSLWRQRCGTPSSPASRRSTTGAACRRSSTAPPTLGAAAGLIIASVLADKHGTKPIVLLWFGLSAVCLALLSIKVENAVLLNALVFVTGVFVFSSQVLVYAWVSQLFPGPPVPGSASAFSFNAMAAYAPARTNAPDNCRLRQPASYGCLLTDVILWFCTQTWLRGGIESADEG